MSKALKNMLIEDITKKIGDNKDMLVLDSSKLDPVTDHKLRMGLRQKNISVMTVRNNLATHVLKQRGVNVAGSLFSGPSTLVWGAQDIVELSKEITKWVKDIEKLELKGGTVEGATLKPEDVERLSKSPGRKELIGRIAGMILSPGGQLAGALLGPGGYLNGQIKAKGEEEAAAPVA